MSIKLKGSTDGSVTLQAPADTSPTGTDKTLILPTGVGSANQTLKNGSTAGTLEFVTHRGFVTYAIIAETESAGVSAGSFTSGDWRTRDLTDTPITDPDNIVSVSNNQFTLGAGTYLIEASAPAYHINAHQARLYNATDSSVVQYGQNAYATSADNVQTNAYVSARFTITASKAFEIQHRSTLSKTVNGLGIGFDFGSTMIYTVVKIFKEA
jgi:hypothetical protein|tara:strand:- start:197 stop:829 length:633 start_codon:yes stop_codon:yes gene_type:complete